MRRPTQVHCRQAAGIILAGLAGFAVPAWAATQDPVSHPLGGGNGATLEPVAPPVRPATRRPVFVCQEGGVPVFADRPCGAAAASRTLVVAAPGPGAAPSTKPPVPQGSTRPRALPADANEVPDRRAETQCTKLERQLDDLNDRMRTGYSAREAARLWHRWRDLKDRLRRERC